MKRHERIFYIARGIIFLGVCAAMEFPSFPASAEESRGPTLGVDTNIQSERNEEETESQTQPTGSSEQNVKPNIPKTPISATESSCEKVIVSGIEATLIQIKYDRSGIKDKKARVKEVNALLERLPVCVSEIPNLPERRTKLQSIRNTVIGIIANTQNIALKLRGVDVFIDDIKADVLTLSRLGHSLLGETPETLEQSYQFINNDLQRLGSEELQQNTLKRISDLVTEKFDSLGNYIEQNDIVSKFNQKAAAKYLRGEVDTVKACQAIANSLTPLDEIKPLLAVSCMENFETAQFLYRTMRKRKVVRLNRFATLTEGNSTVSDYNIQLRSSLPRVNFQYTRTPAEQCKIQRSGGHNGMPLDLTIAKNYDQGPWEGHSTKVLECKNGHAPPSAERLSLCSKYRELAESKFHDAEVACHSFLGTPDYYKALLKAKYCLVQLMLNRTKEFVFYTVKGVKYVDSRKAPFWFKKVKEHLGEINREAKDLGISVSSISDCRAITNDQKSFFLDNGSNAPPGKWANPSYIDAYYYFSELIPNDFGGPAGFLINGSIPAQWHPLNQSCNIVTALAEFRDYNGICSTDDEKKESEGEDSQGE